MKDLVLVPFLFQGLFSAMGLIISTSVLLIYKNNQNAKPLFRWSSLGLLTCPFAIILWPIAIVTALTIAARRAFA